MHVSEALLARYFRNECTPEEKLLVAAFLEKTEEWPDHLLKKEEWDDAQDAFLPQEKSTELFEAVKKQTYAKPLHINWKKTVSIAAVLALVCSIGLFWPRQQQSAPSLSQSTHTVRKPGIIQWKSIVNYTDQVQEMSLPDASTVKIYPGGALRYALPFVKVNREIYLHGKSFFQVTKDKKHPFIVYSKGISTTALGTSFTITASDQDKFVKVELHTGKVWIKDADSTHHVRPFSRILLPGNALVYNNVKNEVKVLLPETLIAKKEFATELTFDQAPLVEVFAKLETHYKIKISYNSTELTEMSFTGTLNLVQPIDQILKEITELNKLNQIKTTEGYLIKK